MKHYLLLKKNHMKTDDPMIRTGMTRNYLTAAVTALLFGGLFTGTVTAQGNRHNGDRNGGGRDGGNRHSTVRESPDRNRGGNDRRQDVSINRNPGRDFNNNRNPVAIQRNIDRDRSSNPGFNRDRNNNPSVVTRDFNRDRNINRGNNIDRNVRSNRSFSSRPRVSSYSRPTSYGTLSRPGYRPVYGYNRRPVYDRYNPSWRYGYLPRRNSYFHTLPGSYFSISFGGIGYRYWDGVFYRPYNNLFTVIAPPIGIYINVLPVGYRRIYVHDYPYYYYNGTYYDQRGSNYYVVSPPVGAVVESLPAGYETVVIDGETFYTADGAQYKPAVQENGEIWYEVIKAN